MIHRPLVLLLFGLIASISLSSQQTPASATISVEASSQIPSIPGPQLTASIKWLIDKWYGSHIEKNLLEDTSQEAPWKCKITLDKVLHGFQLRSHLIVVNDISHTRRSWLPLNSIGSITTTAAADCFQLWSEIRKFPQLQNLQLAPKQTSMLSLKDLNHLSQKRIRAADIRMATTSEDGIFLLLPDGPLALGPKFGITNATTLWLTWRNDLRWQFRDWRTLHVLNDNRLVLEPSDGPLMLMDPNSGDYTILDESTLIKTTRSIGKRGLTLLTVSTTGIPIWHQPGLLVAQAPTEIEASIAPLKIPFGSVLPSAITSDGNGDIWVYDPNERRIRVFSPAISDGITLNQVFSVTPMLPREELSEIQTLSITSDNHILLGSRRAIWKLDYRGIPRWVLRLLNEEPRQSLPQAFSIAGHFNDSGLLLLDRTSGSLYRFDESTNQRTNRDPLSLLQIELLNAGSLFSELATKSLLTAENVWHEHNPLAAQYLLGTANRFLNKWRAYDPIAPGINELETAVNKFTNNIDRALFSEPLFEIEISPDTYYLPVSEFYRDHPFTMTIKNLRSSPISGTTELKLPGTFPLITSDPVTIESGDEVSMSVSLNFEKKHFEMNLSNHLTLWLKTKVVGEKGYILTPINLSLLPYRCMSESPLTSFTDIDRNIFFQSNLLAQADEPVVMPMPTGEIIKQIAKIARIKNTVEPCKSQSISHTLTTLSGTSEDWTLALAVILSNHQVPVTLLLSTSGSTILLVQDRSNENNTAFSDFELDRTSLRQLSSRLKKTNYEFSADPVWALRPHSVENRTDIGKTWLASGLEETRSILKQQTFSWRLVEVYPSDQTTPPYRTTKTINWPIILPLGSVSYAN